MMESSTIQLQLRLWLTIGFPRRPTLWKGICCGMDRLDPLVPPPNRDNQSDLRNQPLFINQKKQLRKENIFPNEKV